jgi:hypothetical protein
MAEPTTLLSLSMGPASNPGEEAEARKRAAATSEAWHQARARRPRVEAALVEIEGMLPRIEHDISLAELALSAAGYAVVQKVVQQQGGNALGIGGAPAVAFDDELRTDPAVLVAQAHVTTLVQGKARLLEQRETCQRELEAVRQGPPPAAG